MKRTKRIRNIHGIQMKRTKRIRNIHGIKSLDEVQKILHDQGGEKEVTISIGKGYRKKEKEIKVKVSKKDILSDFMDRYDVEMLIDKIYQDVARIAAQGMTFQELKKKYGSARIPVDPAKMRAHKSNFLMTSGTRDRGERWVYEGLVEQEELEHDKKFKKLQEEYDAAVEKYNQDYKQIEKENKAAAAQGADWDDLIDPTDVLKEPEVPEEDFISQYEGEELAAKEIVAAAILKRWYQLHHPHLLVPKEQAGFSFERTLSTTTKPVLSKLASAKEEFEKELKKEQSKEQAIVTAETLFGVQMPMPIPLSNSHLEIKAPEGGWKFLDYEMELPRKLPNWPFSLSWPEKKQIKSGMYWAKSHIEKSDIPEDENIVDKLKNLDLSKMTDEQKKQHIDFISGEVPPYRLANKFRNIATAKAKGCKGPKGWNNNPFWYGVYLYSDTMANDFYSGSRYAEYRAKYSKFLKSLFLDKWIRKEEKGERTPNKSTFSFLQVFGWVL